MTAQVAEKIIIEEKKLSLLTEPLAPLWEEKDIEFTSRSTSCWRGYIGTWELKDDGLYLIAFDGRLGDKIIQLKDLSRTKSSSPVKATWFSGELRMPIGEMVIYVHGGYASSYSEELRIKIDKGDAVSFVHDIFHFKKVRELTSLSLFSEETFYHDVYKVDFKESFDISKDEMIDIINKKKELPKHGTASSYNF